VLAQPSQERTPLTASRGVRTSLARSLNRSSPMRPPLPTA